jgi:hypothetical protein
MRLRTALKEIVIAQNFPGLQLNADGGRETSNPWVKEQAIDQKQVKHSLPKFYIPVGL